jgi:hypothetical protein
MAAPQPTKPIFNKPSGAAPFKVSEDAPSPPRPNGDWQPISQAPQDPQARFMVRATVNDKPVGGTETLVRYRASRKMVGRKWQSALTIIDDRLGTKLGFRPTEWCPATKEQLEHCTWDQALANAATEAKARNV